MSIDSNARSCINSVSTGTPSGRSNGLAANRFADVEHFALQLHHEWQIILVLYAQAGTQVSFHEDRVAACCRGESGRRFPIDHAKMTLIFSGVSWMGC